MGVHKELIQLPNGTTKERWRVDFTWKYPDGKQARIRELSPIQNKRGAEEHERQLRFALQLGTYKQALPPKVETLSEFLPQYWAYAKLHHKASNLHDKENRLRRDVLPVLGDKPIDQIGVADKDKLASKLKERGLQASTINNSLGALGSILRYAEEIEVIDSAPASRFLKVPEAKFDFFTFEEYDRILAVAPDVRSSERLAKLLISGDAGLRLGEVRALGWDDIDFVAGHLTVNYAFWRKIKGPPKGGRSRKIPMTERLKRELLSIRHLKGPLVFCNDDGSLLSADAFDGVIERLSKRAGLRSIGWHGLRHTFCSHLAMRGATTKAIQELAGHQSLMTTQRYMHLAPSHLREAIRLLEPTKGSAEIVTT
jgi:integrase